MAAMLPGGGQSGGVPAPGAPADYVKLFKAEKDNLEFAEGQYKWAGEGIEQRILERWGKLSSSSKAS